MSVRFVLGRAGSGKTHHCLTAIRAGLAEHLVGSPALVLLVPEQAASQMERALLADPGLPGLGRAEVLSFRRLAHRILSACRPDATPTVPLPVVLTDVGRNMVLRELILERGRTLREFADVAARPGFVAALSRATVELIQQAVPPDRLDEAAQAAAAAAETDPDAAASAGRLHDLALLYRAYLDYLGSQRADPEGVLDLARARIDAAEWLAGAHVYVDGFAGFTRQQVRLLAELAGRAQRMDVTLLVDPTMISRNPAGRWEFGNSQAQGSASAHLFRHPIETGRELMSAFRAAGIAIDEPLLLQPSPPPRFTSAALSKLERRLFLPAPGDEPPALPDGSVRLVAAADRRAEVRAVAGEIARLCRTGDRPLRYRDIAVVTRDIEPFHDLLAAALREHDIPYFMDRRRTVSHHPLVEAVRSLLRLRADRSAAALPELLHSGLTPWSQEACDALENYQRAHGLLAAEHWIEGDWKYPPWDTRNTARSATEALAAINATRQALVTALAVWWPATTDSNAGATCRAMAIALWTALERLGVPARLEAWARAAAERGDPDEAGEHQQVWTRLVELMEELVATLGDRRMTAVEFREVIEAGLADFTLGLAPSTLDCVLVGSIERSRHPAIRRAFIIGFADGQFPATPTSAELLEDPERRLLAARGIPLRPQRRDRLLEEQLLAYIALTRASAAIWVSWPQADDSSRPTLPSPYLEIIRTALGTATPAIESLPFAEDAATPDVCTTPASLAAGLGRRLHELAERPSDIRPGDEWWLALYERARRGNLPPAIQRHADAALSGLAGPKEAVLDAEAIELLKPHTLRSSVSRLETFAACPFRHFARHTLGLRPRRESDLTPIDVGAVYHAMLEQFVRGMLDEGETLTSLSDVAIADRLAGVADQAITQLESGRLLPEANRRVLRRRGRLDLRDVLRAEKRRIQPGLRPLAVEVVFGRNGRLPALEVRLSDGRVVHIDGRIDRIDYQRSGETARLLVFDYKKGPDQRLNLYEVVEGLSLQLLTYLLVLKDHNERLADDIRRAENTPEQAISVTPTGAFYLPLSAPPLSASFVKPEENDALQGFRPRGVFDSDALATLDPATEPGKPSKLYVASVNKDGHAGNRNLTDVVTPKELDALLEHVRGQLARLAEGAFSGCIEVSPVRLPNRLACLNCAFASVCRFERATGKVRSIESRKRTDVLNSLAPAEPQAGERKAEHTVRPAAKTARRKKGGTA